MIRPAWVGAQSARDLSASNSSIDGVPLETALSHDETGRVGWWKIPAASNGDETHAEAQCRARDRRRGGWPVQQVPADDNSRAAERGERVYVRPQHDRNLVDEQVAQDAPADAAQHPEQRRDNRIDAECQRLLRARHR